MKKHQHQWTFKKEEKKLIEILMPKERILRFLNPLLAFSLYVPIYNYYNVFVCECGKQKRVLIKE